MSLQSRPPVVAIMGHVDHGKTSLLDAIRKTDVVSGEAGGITQHIGAYQIEYDKRKITFIDTPGHAAFSAMRSRGAQVTDIVILVVAADDGVKPQTVESIQHIKAAQVDFIVAITKIDMPGANIINVKTQLAEHEVFLEGFGGSVSAVEVSSKTKKGVSDLLELILLTADVADLKADSTAAIQGVVIESGMDSRIGPYATILVQNGTLTPRQEVFIGEQKERIRVMTDAAGAQVKTALPAMPVRVQGFSKVPLVGSVVSAESIVTEVKKPLTELDQYGDALLQVILKTDVAGSQEAILASLPGHINVVAAGVGEINESDVLLAQTTRSRIIGFNVRVSKSVEELASTHGVKIKTYKIIYEMLEDLERQLFILEHPDMNEEELGTAEIIAQFDMRGEKIAGCKVQTGEMKRGQHIFYHIKRGEEKIASPRVRSMKQGKSNVDLVKAPGECGIVFRSAVTFKIGDIVSCYTLKEL